MSLVKQFAVIDKNLLLDILSGNKTNPSSNPHSDEIGNINLNIQKQKVAKRTARTKLNAINQLLSKKHTFKKQLNNTKLGSSDNPMKIEYVNQKQSSDSFTASDPWVVRTIADLKGTQRINALNLMKYIHSTPGISWNKNGQLVINDEVQDSTDIGDLVSDAVRTRITRKTASKYEIFSRELKNINTPREYIKNKLYLQEFDGGHERGRTPSSSPRRYFSLSPIQKGKGRIFKKKPNIRNWIAKLI